MLLKENSNALKRKAFDSVNRIKNNRQVFIESHRGVNKEEPENSMRAFRKAIEYECDSIELDIWLTQDGIPVVIHGKDNGEISETTNGNGIISDLTFRDLCAFELKVSSDPIPSLEDVLELCKEQIFLNIEIKDPNYSLALEKILELIVKYEMKEQIAISSFKHQYWQEIKKFEHVSDIEFGFLYDTTEGKNEEIKFECPNSTMNLWYKEIRPELVKKAHEMGIGVHVWFCMDDEETDELINYLIECEVDVICSNAPKKVINVRESLMGVCK